MSPCGVVAPILAPAAFPTQVAVQGAAVEDSGNPLHVELSGGKGTEKK